jgi:hypothetical protein
MPLPSKDTEIYRHTGWKEEFLTYAADMGLAAYIHIHTNVHTDCSDTLKLIAGTHIQNDLLISLFFFKITKAS